MFDKRIYIYTVKFVIDRISFSIQIFYLYEFSISIKLNIYIYICIVKFREKCVEDVRIGEETAVDGKCDRHEWRLRRSVALYGDIWLEVISVAR